MDQRRDSPPPKSPVHSPKIPRLELVDQGETSQQSSPSITSERLKQAQTVHASQQSINTTTTTIGGRPRRDSIIKATHGMIQTKTSIMPKQNGGRRVSLKPTSISTSDVHDIDESGDHKHGELISTDSQDEDIMRGSTARRRSSRRSSMVPAHFGMPLGGQVALGTLARLDIGSSRVKSPAVYAGKDTSTISSDNVNVRESMVSRRKQSEINYRKATQPLQGAVTFQLILHYLAFVVILVAATLTWADDIMGDQIISYIMAAFCTIQVQRLMFSLDLFAASPIYLTLIPFAFMIFTSRQTHMILAVLWYVSLICVYLQVGNQFLHWHILIFSAVFLLVYGIVVLALDNLGICSPINPDGSCVFRERSMAPIDWRREALLMIACAHIVLCGMALERFIKINALAFLERETYLESMAVMNADLKQKSLNKPRRTDVRSPLVKAIEILTGIRNSITDGAQADALTNVISILVSDQLFKPSLTDKPVDEEVQGFLLNVLQTISKASPVQIKTESEAMLPRIGSVVEFTQSNSSLLRSINNFNMDRSLDKFLQGIDTPNGNFNVLELGKLCPGKSLLVTLATCIEKTECLRKLSIPVDKLTHWISKVENGYVSTNPYHNASHAADVTYMMYYFLTRSKFQKDFVFSEEEVFAALLASAVHDYKHPGLNNAFHVNTQHPLALRYNDNAVLEQYHLASAFELLNDPSCNFMSSLPMETRKNIRNTIISLVLSTDMALHFEWIGKFKNRLITSTGFDWNKVLDRRLVLNMAMKTSDVNNAAKPFALSAKWTEMITEEFFRQGDEERRRGLPVSAFMNRENADIPKSQVAFIDYIVNPLFEPWISFVGDDIKVLGENITKNRANWKTKSEQQHNTPMFGGGLNVPAAVKGSSKLRNPPIVADLSRESSNEGMEDTGNQV